MKPAAPEEKVGTHPMLNGRKKDTIVVEATMRERGGRWGNNLERGKKRGEGEKEKMFNHCRNGPTLIQSGLFPTIVGVQW